MLEFVLSPRKNRRLAVLPFESLQSARIPGWSAVLAPAVLVLLVACGRDGAASAAPDMPGTPVALLDYVAVAPPAWQARPPASTMRLAEFALPDAGGETEPSEVVVFFFGPGQGGSVEANLNRWSAQFSDAEGNHPEPAIQKVPDAAFATTIVEFRGNYARGIGMGGTPDEAKPDQILLAAVVETPGGNLYVQAHGPAASIMAQEDAFRAFVSGIRSHPQS
jgi:hypothetical protein